MLTVAGAFTRDRLFPHLRYYSTKGSPRQSVNQQDYNKNYGLETIAEGKLGITVLTVVPYDYSNIIIDLLV